MDSTLNLTDTEIFNIVLDSYIIQDLLEPLEIIWSNSFILSKNKIKPLRS